MQESNEYYVPFEKTVEILKKYEVPLINYCWVKKTTEIKESINEKINFPAVVKLISPLFLHKSDAGLVALDVQSPEEIEQVSSWMIERISGGEYEGILIQEQAKAGTEVVIGINYDSQFGPIVLFGAGGVFVEYLEDHVIGIPPLTHQLAHELIFLTKIGNLLKGVRNKPPADIVSLVDLIYKVSRIAVENRNWIKSLDLNPVVVYEKGQGVRVLDFRLFSRKPTLEG